MTPRLHAASFVCSGRRGSIVASVIPNSPRTPAWSSGIESSPVTSTQVAGSPTTLTNSRSNGSSCSRWSSSSGTAPRCLGRAPSARSRSDYPHQRQRRSAEPNRSLRRPARRPARRATRQRRRRSPDHSRRIRPSAPPALLADPPALRPTRPAPGCLGSRVDR